MSSFFVSSDKVKVGQSSISIPAENGLSYAPGGKIDLYIPPTSKFVDLSQSRLQMRVKLQVPTSIGVQRLQLDAETGLHSLIDSIRIYTGRKTALLEEIQGYDIYTALRFDYETNQNMVNKRVMTEGATAYDPACRGTLGTTQSPSANCFSNPYFSKVEGNTSLTASFTEDKAASSGMFQEVKGELHLNTGLFRNTAVFPTVLTDGLFIEIVLKRATALFRQLDSTTRNRRLRLNPKFDSVNGSDAGPSSWANGAAITSFFTTQENNQTSLPTCPFVVGQDISFVSSDNASLNGSVARITLIEHVSGSTVGVSKTKYTITSTTNNTGEAIVDAGTGGAQGYYLVSRTSEVHTTYSPTLTIDGVNLIVEEIQVPDGYEQSMMGMMSEGGTINYDYRTVTNYRHSQVKDDIVANIRLPLIESRATSILCVPTDATPYSTQQALSCDTTYLVNNESGDVVNRSNRSGLVGVSDFLQNYQWIYDSKINPSRPIDVKKISDKDSISQQWCVEAEKSLAMADIEPLSFLNFQNNFFLGRALALGKNAVYDARGKDFNLQLEYTGTTPTVGKLWHNYVAHLRRLVIRNGSISVQV
tara:strand:+ start:610 stop:2373 length:1764 start_codon:yes stop_codon:yes gene_type:complete